MDGDDKFYYFKPSHLNLFCCRIMKGKDMGDSTKVNFHKKYCGKRTASLKFSGEDTIKMVFKSSQESRQELSNLDGWTCKVTCKSPSLNFNKPKPTTPSFLDMLATAKPVTTPSTTTTTETTTTTTPTTTSTTPAPSSQCQCGVPTHAAKSRWNQLKIQGKIICPPGEICDSDPVPWQVGFTNRGSNNKPWCGGTIINAQYILSAAHCFESGYRRDPNKIMVTLGDHDWSVTGEWPTMRINVKSILNHPKFRSGAYFNYDFAIIKLERPIDFQQYDWLRPACLPNTEQNFLDDQTARVTGWGWTDAEISSQSKVLQSVDVDIMSHKSCVDHYNKNVSSEDKDDFLFCISTVNCFFILFVQTSKASQNCYNVYLNELVTERVF